MSSWNRASGVVTWALASAAVAFLALPATAVPIAPNDGSIAGDLQVWLRNPASNFNGTTWSDSSGNGRHAVASAPDVAGSAGLVVSSSGPFAGVPIDSVRFVPSANDLMVSSDLNGDAGSSDWTIFALYATNSSVELDRPVGIGPRRVGPANGHLKLANDGSLRFDNGNNTSNPIPSSSGDVFLRTVRLDSGSMSQWYDGAVDYLNDTTQSAGTIPNPTSTDDLYLGDTRDTSVDSTSHIIGVAVYNSALTDAQVDGVNEFFLTNVTPAAPMKYRDAVLADGPFAYYRMNEPSGVNSAANLGSAGGALDGPYNNPGGFMREQFSLLPSGEDASIRLDGSANTEIRLPDNAAFNTGTFPNKTVSLWFQADSITTTPQVIFEQGGATRGINIYTQHVAGVDTLFMGAWNLAQSNWPVTFASTPITPGVIYNAVLVLEGDPDNDASTDDGFIRGYLNGLLFEEVAGAGVLRSHGDDGAIGGIHVNARFADNSTMGNGANFFGAIDEVALYNAALNDAQILAQFEAAQAAVPEPATATLALLGVAGLAMRRRRRA